MLTRRLALSAPLFLVLGSAFLATPAHAQSVPGRLKVVASFSILGDVAAQIGGDRVSVETLVGPDGDAHVYSPSPADGRKLAEAKLIVVNGLKFEGWIDRLIKASGAAAPTVVAAKGVQTIRVPGEKGHGHGHAHGHDHRGDADPHAWQDVRNVRIYATNIRDGLIAVDPAGKAAYESATAAYLARLDALDAEIRAEVARIPQARRRIIAGHDSFGYFQKAYGLEFRSPRGVSTDAEASARDVARIIRQIKAEKIPAVFLENVSDPRLIEQIARETGAKVGGKLFSDALSGPNGPAPTYIDMMRHNIKVLSSALTPTS